MRIARRIRSPVTSCTSNTAITSRSRSGSRADSWSWGANWEKGRAPAAEMLLDAMSTVPRPRAGPLEARTGRCSRSTLAAKTGAVRAVESASMVRTGTVPPASRSTANSVDAACAARLRHAAAVRRYPDAAHVEDALAAVDPALVPRARGTWGVMKIWRRPLRAAVRRYCLLDDDFFILDNRIDHVLRLHQDHTFGGTWPMRIGAAVLSQYMCPRTRCDPGAGKVDTGYI